jgi:hypothetical protein
LNAQVTPDGRHLLFVSSGNVTGYEAGGKTEIYLYSAGSETTVCVSCRGDGEAPLGDARLPEATGSDAYHGSYSPYPRTISDDGSRAFFTSPEALTPGAIAGKGLLSEENVYEWEKGQLYLLAARSQLRNASASGEDVFITSDRQLDPRYDTDFVQDAYDVRVNGGFPDPAPPPPSCDALAGECEPPPTPAPASSQPASQSFSGPGNPPVSSPAKRCSKKAAGKCKKPHKKQKAHKRHKNRATGNNRGGAK